jgi:hypothetical protein
MNVLWRFQRAGVAQLHFDAGNIARPTPVDLIVGHATTPGCCSVVPRDGSAAGRQRFGDHTQMCPACHDAIAFLY